MPRLAVTTEVRTEVKLAPALKTKLMKRLKRYAELSELIKAAQLEQETIKDDVDRDFTDAGEGNALFNGCAVDSFRVKMVCGTTSKLDEDALMKDHGLTRADLDACTDTKPSKPYVKITPPEKPKAKKS